MKKIWLVIGGAGVLILLLSKKAGAAGHGGGIPKKYRGLVETYSRKHGIPLALLAAIVQVESGWNPNAYRAEPRLKDASMGLGQILGKTAIAYGFKGPLASLYNPEINLDWTGLILGKLRQRYGLSDAIAAYNAGTPRKTRQNRYINQNYVDKVLRYYRSFS